MESFIHVAWAQHHSPTPAARPSLGRFHHSYSKNDESLNVPQVTKMSSTQPVVEDDFCTTPDPRSRAMSPANVPENNEVATLNDKLVNALNYTTRLDDALSASQERIRELESCVSEEKERRTEAEQQRKKMEQEVEDLTAQLFLEAQNKIASAQAEAQKEQDELQRKNDQLRQQLADSESILSSQAEQLAELKDVIKRVAEGRDDRSGTTPSSPGFSKFDSRDDDGRVLDTTAQTPITEPSSPTHPTNLSYLVQPVLRTDVSSYEEFLELVKTAKKSSNRASSGSYSGFSQLLNLGSAQNSPDLSAQAPNSPALNASAGSSPSTAPAPPLEKTKFFKRVLAEDIEPTLRLDVAPSITRWSRQTVLNAITEGTLVVEPVPTNSPFAAINKPQVSACSLCGESRKDAGYLRNHRFRINEDSGRTYPLCDYCHVRVRSTCEFMSFLRMVKDGHWRADDADSERSAWEESVKLREQMFWSRIGGGVIPALPTHTHPVGTGEKSPRPSAEGLHITADVEAAPEIKTEVSSDERCETPTPKPAVKTVESAAVDEPSETRLAADSTLPEDGRISTSSSRYSLQEIGNQRTETSTEEMPKRLSINIPGF